MTYSAQIATAFTPIAAGYDAPSVTRALTWSANFVQTYCDQPFDLVTGLVYVDPQPYRSALLPYVPVVTVTLVEGLLPPAIPTPAGLTWQTLTNYAFTPDTGLIYDTTGQPGVGVATAITSWPWVPRGLRVTYTYGYAAAPQAVVDVACRLAQQYLENPATMMQRRVGDTEARFSGSKGLVLNELDKVVLDRYMNVGVG